MNRLIKLADVNKCTGCGACCAICNVGAIEMVENEDGFIYPRINEGTCLSCGLCSSVCSVIQEKRNKPFKPINVYAAVAKDARVAKTSSSGGVFALIAEKVIKMKGIVYGCAIDEQMKACHIRVDSIERISQLKGSKYIQSDLSNSFELVKKDLNEGKLVLFSGTPCQVNGLKCYLKKEYEQLLTVDLVCHGVPSYRFFRQYIDWYQKKNNVKIDNYCFRDKTKTDVSCVSRIDFVTSSGKKKSVLSEYSPKYYFYYYYMMGDIYRESCYQCPSIPEKRMADITLGDFWGVEEIYPNMNIKNGMSVVITHSNRGQEYVEGLDMEMEISSIEEATKNNKSIIRPVNRSNKKEALFSISREHNGEELYNYCRKDMGYKKYVYQLKAKIPIGFKRKLLKLIKNKL